jgi:hypothetical protein
MYLEAFARPPTADENRAVVAFLSSQSREHGNAAGDASSDDRVWADLAHVLINAKEFQFID